MPAYVQVGRPSCGLYFSLVDRLWASAPGISSFEMHGMQANVNWALPDRVMHAVGECFAVSTCVAKRTGSPEQRPCAGACASDGCFRMFTG